jgi:hypothetical protein
VLLVIAGAIYLRLHGSSTAITPAPPAPSPIAAPLPPPAPAGLNFAGLPIMAQDTVIYLLDNGGSASDFLPAMQAAAMQSIQSLGSERRFKVIFWREDSPAYPADGTARATPEEQAKCRAALQDVYAQGTTEVDAALKMAMACQPDAIILATAKGAQLPDDFLKTVLAIRGDSQVKIYTIGVNGDSTTDPAHPGILATLAKQTGGQFLNISSGDLNRLAH